MDRTTDLETSRSLLDWGHWRWVYQSSCIFSTFGQDWQDDVWRCRIAARTSQWRSMYVGWNISIATMSPILSLSVYLAKSMCYRLTQKVSTRLAPAAKKWYKLATDERISIQHTTFDFDQNESFNSPLWGKSLCLPDWPAGSLQASSELTYLSLSIVCTVST